jgi:hypothetical protein
VVTVAVRCASARSRASSPNQPPGPSRQISSNAVNDDDLAADDHVEEVAVFALGHDGDPCGVLLDAGEDGQALDHAWDQHPQHRHTLEQRQAVRDVRISA